MPPKVSKPPTHKCSQCDKCFPSKRELILHQYIHQEKPNTTCSLCQRTFPNKHSYKLHMRIHSDKMKRCKICQICEEAFQNSQELDKHHREIHLGDKFFRCKSCGAEFSWQENLRKHMRMHKPDGHECQICHKSFDDMTSLRIHNKNAHEQKPDNDKPFNCHLCHKSFKYDFSYEAHLNAHQVPVSSPTPVPTVTATSSTAAGQAPRLASTSKLVVAGPATRPVSTPADSTNGNLQVVKQVVQPDKEGIINIKPVDPKMNNMQEIIVEIVNVPPPGTSSLEEKQPPAPDLGVEPNKVNVPASMSDAVKPKDQLVGKIENPFSPESLGLVSQSSIKESTGDLANESKNPSKIGTAKEEEEEEEDFDDDDEEEEDDEDEEEEAASEDNEDSSLQIVTEEEAQGSPPELRNEQSTSDNPCEGRSGSPPQLSLARPTGRRGNKQAKQKKEKTKRNIRPLRYDFVMTEEKPYVCEICQESFRWEISLNIHRKKHEEAKQNADQEKSKKKKRGSGRKQSLPAAQPKQTVCVIQTPQVSTATEKITLEPAAEPQPITLQSQVEEEEEESKGQSPDYGQDIEECLNQILRGTHTDQGPTEPIENTSNETALISQGLEQQEEESRKTEEETATSENVASEQASDKTAEKHTQTCDLEELLAEEEDMKSPPHQSPTTHTKTPDKPKRRGKRRASGRSSRIVQPNASDEEDYHEVMSSPELSPDSKQGSFSRQQKPEDNKLKMRLKKGEGQGYMLVTAPTVGEEVNINGPAPNKSSAPPAKRPRGQHSHKRK